MIKSNTLSEYLERVGIEEKELIEYIKRKIFPLAKKFYKNKGEKKRDEEILKEINLKIGEIIEKVENIKFEKYEKLLNWITQQYTTGFLSKLKKNKAWELLISLLILKSIFSNEYTTSIFYTTQTRDKGLGYYLPSEKISEEDLILETLKHLESFYRVQWFSRDEGYLYEIIAFGKLKEELKEEIEGSTLDEQGFSFERIVRYNPEILSKKRDRENLIIKYPNLVLFFVIDYLLTKMYIENKEPSYNDYAEIFVVSNRLVHRRYYIFPNIFEIYKTFYSSEKDFVIIEEEGLRGEWEKLFLGSKLSKFVLSLWIKHPDYSEESLVLLDKLIYYLFNGGKINGEILNKLIILIVTFSKRENRSIRIKYLDFILGKYLSKYNITKMDAWQIEKWGEIIGKTILDSKYREKYGLDESRAKKIVSRIIDELKVENIPGRFFEKLVRILKDYELPVKVDGFDITKVITDEKVKNKMDNFFYVKALILSGLLRSLQ